MADTKEVTLNIGCLPVVAVTVALVALKAGGVIDWPWWLVLCPIWIGPAAVIAFFGALMLVGLVALVFAGIVAAPFVIWEKLDERRWRKKLAQRRRV
jgi:hypothetical protein